MNKRIRQKYKYSKCAHLIEYAEINDNVYEPFQYCIFDKNINTCQNCKAKSLSKKQMRYNRRIAKDFERWQSCHKNAVDYLKSIYNS